jgi:hypothetical protein
MGAVELDDVSGSGHADIPTSSSGTSGKARASMASKGWRPMGSTKGRAEPGEVCAVML